ncbi:MAG: protein kinase [Actinomycetota bacterium]|nr:protein kinase [Actinomycetota bacterium]
MKKLKYKKGDAVGPWTLLNPLGTGRNAEVWEVDQTAPKAMKILLNTKPLSEPFKRFGYERAILEKLKGRQGVLPLLEAQTPDQPSKRRPAWLLFPVATPLRDALADAPFEVVVRAMRDLARVLDGLHAEGIFHRDIKPENAFRFGHAFVFGDFGLVDFPNKEEITHLREDGRGPGPLYYLAPELLMSGDVPPGPADVYAFAKTIWVVGCGQRLPIQGPLDPATPATRLSAYVNDPRATLLDRLLYRATRTDAGDRPSIGEVADELEAWLREPGDPTWPDVDELIAGIVAAGEPERRRGEEIAQLIALASTSLNALVDGIRPLEAAYDKMKLYRVPRDEDDIVFRAFRRPQTIGTARIIQEWGLATRVYAEKGGMRFFMATGYGMQLREDGSARLGAGHIVGYLTGGSRENFLESWIWDTGDLDIGSATEETERKAVIDNVIDAFPHALARFRAALSGGTQP